MNHQQRALLKYFPSVSISRLRLLTGALFPLIFLAGCGHNSTFQTPNSAATLVGSIKGGQQPVAGATIQLYAANTTIGDGYFATTLLPANTTSDQYGNFSITSKYTCPAPDALVYLVATGGNPGLSSGSNPNLALMAALGSCNALISSANTTYLTVNEVTTVASVAALSPYMASYSAIGSGPTDASQMAAAFSLVNEYANVSTGTAPGPTLPGGYYASSNEINTLANIISTCINSSGGKYGDGTACGNLFYYGKSGGAYLPPTDTIAAVLNIIKNPFYNVASIFGLAPAVAAPFQPTIATVPASWNLPIIALTPTPTISLATGIYAGAQTVKLSDTNTAAAIYYTLDQSTPTTASFVYSGSISIGASETIKAVAIAPGLVASNIASSTYTLTPATVHSMSIVSGNSQSAAAGQPFVGPLLITALDAASNPVSGALVFFQGPSTGAGAILSSSSCTTNATGNCYVIPTANSLAGTYTVESGSASASVNFTLTNTAPSTNHSYLVSVTTDTTSGISSNCVDQSSGSKASNANCSLRDALAAAAANTSAFATASIAFAQTVASTITLSNGTLNIPSYTTIQGATSGSGLTLQNLITVTSNEASTLFTVASGVVQVAINNLVLNNGGTTTIGGAIYNSGALAISASSFTNNFSTESGGAIGNNGGTLSITGCTFANNEAQYNYGGAIDNFTNGVISVSNSTFFNNQAPGLDGGAIYNHGTAFISNSTIYGNSAYSGGGIYNYPPSTLVVTGSIFAQNTPSDCGAFACNPLWVYVAISATNATTIASSSINIAFKDSVGNSFSQTAPVGQDSSAVGIAATFGPYFFENFSGLDTTFITGQGFGPLLIITPANGAPLTPLVITNPSNAFSLTQEFFPTVLSSGNNIYGVTASQLNLSTLGSNGGPTQTMVPQAGSVALCSISPATSTTGTDQRGQPRSVTSGITTCQDAGAVQTSY